MDNILDPRLRGIARAIAARKVRGILPSRSDGGARWGDAGGYVQASVALVVRPEPRNLEVLLIKRAPRAGDPWSGHMALPGGRRDVQDPDPLSTAMRETLEEVGIDLRTTGTPLGALDEVQPLDAGVPPLVISPFAFSVPTGTAATPNVEVDAALWIPLRELTDPAARAEHLHPFADGTSLRFPALSCRGHTVWGLTYRVLSQFLQLAAPNAEARG
ncbi:CoA pyrophosphatase [soil metagenome]